MADLHPWMAIKAAIEDGNKEAAREALANADSRLTGRMRIGADQAIKRAFPPEPGEFASAAERRQIENEASNASPVASALARRREGRQQCADAIMKHHKPSRGPAAILGPVEEDDRYRKAEPGGFNTPVNDAPPTREGRGRDRIKKAYPR